MAPPEPLETLQWRISPRTVSIQLVALHIALQLLFRFFFSFCRSSIVNDNPGVVANWDHTSEWVPCVSACIGIWNVMGDAAESSPHVPSTCVHNTIRSLLIVHIIRSRQIYVAVDNPSLPPSMSCLITGNDPCNYVPAANNVSHADISQSNDCLCLLICKNFEPGSNLPEFSGIMVSARANQYSTKAPSSFKSLISNSYCS